VHHHVQPEDAAVTLGPSHAISLNQTAARSFSSCLRFSHRATSYVARLRRMFSGIFFACSLCMRKPSVLLFVSALAISSIASLPRVCAEGSRDSAAAIDNVSTCGDQYNADLARARAALIKGNRAEALTALIAAKAQLQRCQEREERNSTVAVGLNWPDPDPVSVVTTREPVREHCRSPQDRPSVRFSTAG
jgi:hypothetical protein